MRSTYCTLVLATLLVLFGAAPQASAQETGFSAEDRERLVRLEATLQVFMSQTDKRFEDVNNRIDQLISFLWIIVGLFTAITLGSIGLAYWDRRSYIRQAREETIRVIEREGQLTHLIQALRDVAPNQPDLASALRKYGLL